MNDDESPIANEGDIPVSKLLGPTPQPHGSFWLHSTGFSVALAITVRSFPSSKISFRKQFWLLGAHLALITKHLKINDRTAITFYHKTESNVEFVSPRHPCSYRQTTHECKEAHHEPHRCTFFAIATRTNEDNSEAKPFICTQKCTSISVCVECQAAVEKKGRNQMRIYGITTTFRQHKINCSKIPTIKPTCNITNSANTRQPTLKRWFITNTRYLWSQALIHKGDSKAWTSTVRESDCSELNNTLQSAASQWEQAGSTGRRPNRLCKPPTATLLTTSGS